MRDRRKMLVNGMPLGSSGPSDTTRPAVTITSSESSPSSAAAIPLTITFSESVTGFLVGDITVAGCTLGALGGSGAVYTVNATPTATLITVDIAEGVCADAAGNTNLAATQFVIVSTVDQKFWWKADNGTFEDTALTIAAADDGDVVKGWTDNSPAAKHATEATNGPTLKLNIQTGTPMLGFYGSNDKLATASHDPGVGTGDFYFAFVIVPRVLKTHNGIFTFANRLYLYSSRALAQAVSVWTTTDRVFNTVLVVGTAYLVEFWRESGTIKAAVNGSLNATTFADAYDIDAAGAASYIGVENGGVFGQNDIGEIIVYKGYNATVQTQLRAYANTRWVLF
jgi:hypothetical protein